MWTQVIVINGAPQSGKSTFVEMCKSFYSYIDEFSTVDLVKRLAKQLGWNGEKTLKDRKFLSDLKDLLTEWNDIPFKDTEKFVTVVKMKNKLKKCDGIIFIHCREPQEIDRLKKEFNAITLLIRRDAAENQEVSCHSDRNVLNYEYDCVIENNGNLEDLKNKAYNFLKIIIGR